MFLPLLLNRAEEVKISGAAPYGQPWEDKESGNSQKVLNPGGIFWPPSLRGEWGWSWPESHVVIVYKSFVCKVGCEGLPLLHKLQEKMAQGPKVPS